MIEPLDTYDEESRLIEGLENPYEEEFYQDIEGQNPEEDDMFDFEFEDETINDIDFSEFNGDFKSSLKKLNGKLRKPAKVKVKKKFRKPVKGREVRLKPRKIRVTKSSVMFGKSRKTTEKIMVPRDRKVIIEGVDNFIFSKDKMVDAYKNIGYYKGKKLKELILIFNNNGSSDFTIELFNPSSPLDWLFSTSQNLNNRIQVAGGSAASYSDVLFHMLANPTMIVNAKIVMSGSSLVSQQAQALQFKNKNLEGKMRVEPLQISQSIDTMQVQSTTIPFDIMGTLNRPFIPDGMDVCQYTVLAGMTVTLCFYYDQHSLKKLLIPEAKASKKLM